MTDDLEQVQQDLKDQTRLAEERLNRLKYLQSDFDNYRKWSEKDKASTIALANESLIKDLLVILDDFEHALPSLEMLMRLGYAFGLTPLRLLTEALPTTELAWAHPPQRHAL